jgi:hypothetical protein
MDMTIAIIKLAALQKNVESLLRQRAHTCDVATVQDLWGRFTAILADLRSNHQDLLGDVPVRETPEIKHWYVAGRPRDPYIERADVQTLWNDIRYCLDILRGEAAAAAPQVSATREGIFFAGQTFDALQTVAGILGRAQSRIDIVDGYVGPNLLDLLTRKKETVTVRILTKSAGADFRQLAGQFEEQYGGLEVRTSDAFHDRFIMVDGEDFYHFGASIKHAGKRGFMFSKVEEPSILAALRDEFEREWHKAEAVPI